MSNIVFVDDVDNVIGAGTKQDVWAKGIRHRIVRVYVLNSEGKMLIARRALHLSSLPGRWNESAAGHVDEGEEYLQAAIRETEEELGIKNAVVEEVSRFKSEETDEPDKKKNRYTMVYVLHYDGDINPSADEVAETKWLDPKELSEWIERSPDDFTEGFILGFQALISKGIIKV